MARRKKIEATLPSKIAAEVYEDPWVTASGLNDNTRASEEELITEMMTEEEQLEASREEYRLRCIAVEEETRKREREELLARHAMFARRILADMQRIPLESKLGEAALSRLDQEAVTLARSQMKRESGSTASNLVH